MCFVLEHSDSAAEESVVKRPNQRKKKVNPNIQSTSNIQKKQNAEKVSSSDEEEVLVSYKSKRSAMALGPTDQGATAVLVS